MTNERHADAFLRRLLDMAGSQAGREAETKKAVDAGERPATGKQRRHAVRKTARKRRARG